MVEDLCFPIEIIEAPVARADDGLALSSRNGYLDPRERAIAPALYRLLCDVRARIAGGDRDYAMLEARARVSLLEAGMRPDYFSVRCARTLEPAGPAERDLAILAAAWLGRTRLIDNVTLRLE
jgi:pantoate--beta-alanine ligase